MHAMAIHRFGGPEEIRPVELPDPVPGDEDLLVEVIACSINPVDAKIRATGLGMERTFPLVLGYDVCGRVRAAGPAVQGFREGDEVFASPSLVRPGANAELVLVDWRMAAHRPRSVTPEEAAVLPLVSLTAFESLHDRAGVAPGETVLIEGGAGGVGHVAVQMARHAGCRVLTTAGRPESRALCRELKADVVIDHSSQNVVERVLEETGGRGCPVVLDTVGGAVFERAMDCLAVNGRIVSIVFTQTDGVFPGLFRKNATLHLEFMGVPAIHGIRPQRQGDILREVSGMVDEGALRPRVSRVIPLDDLADGHRQIETGHTLGKIAVKVE